MAEVFNEFLAATSQAAGVDERVAFVMDNVPCHWRDAQADIGQHHVVRHLLAYSPFLKIVGNAISVWKAHLKRHLEEVREITWWTRLMLSGWLHWRSLQSKVWCRLHRN